MLLSFLVKFNEGRTIIASSIVTSSQNTLAPEIVKFGRKFYVIKNFDENTSTITNCVVDSHKQCPRT